MSTSSAKTHASNAQSASDTNQKLDYIARAIYELARSMAEIQAEVNRIKSRV